MFIATETVTSKMMFFNGKINPKIENRPAVIAFHALNYEAIQLRDLLAYDYDLSGHLVAPVLGYLYSIDPLYDLCDLCGARYSPRFLRSSQLAPLQLLTDSAFRNLGLSIWYEPENGSAMCEYLISTYENRYHLLPFANCLDR